MAADGRTQRRLAFARIRECEGRQELLAPLVGYWRGRPAPGTIVTSGVVLGEIEVLGVLHTVIAPEHAHGVVMAYDGEHLGETPVGHGDVLLRLGVAELAATTASSTPEAGPNAGGLQFCAPLSGRFYARPAPGKPPFVGPGDELHTGQSIALLEVMKTFNRLTYGGPGLPARARVTAVLVGDEQDVEVGTPLLALEAVDDGS